MHGCRKPHVHLILTAVAAFALAMVCSCAQVNPERRPYLINECMDRAEGHLAQGDTQEAAEIYSVVILADPLNRTAIHHFNQITSQSLIKPTWKGVNFKHAPPAPPLHWATAMATYPVSRFLDMLDLVSFHIGLEGGLLADLHFTHAMQFGLGAGGGVQAGWWQKRNLGLGIEYVGETALGPASASTESVERMGTAGFMARNFPLMGVNQPIADPFQAYYDYYGVGMRLIVLLVGTEIEFHPLELADALAGFATVDFLNDDLLRTRRLKLNHDDREAMDALVNTLSRAELTKNIKMMDQITSGSKTM